MSPFSVVLLINVLAAAPDAEPPTIEQVRATIQSGVGYVEEKGQWWIEEKKCVACHRIGPMMWSLGAARTRGFAVSDRLDEWYDWAIAKSVTENDQQIVGDATNKEGLAQLLLARDLIGGAERPDVYNAFVKAILTDIQADGSWKPGGQLPSQKRPAEETTDVSTMWLALALADYGSGDDRPDGLDKAIKHVEASDPGTSTEWYVTRLLLAKRLADETAAAKMVETLRDQQQPDGGWGWIVGEASDALGTGMSLYAFLRAGVDSDDPAIRRAKQFLIETQRDDGSWAVKGTKAKKKDAVEETAVYWGTAWAVIGLTASLPN